MKTTRLLLNSISKTHYETLNLPRDASIKDIKKAFRKISVGSHPDKYPNDSQKAKLFIKANNAYQILSDPKQKSAYDSSIKLIYPTPIKRSNHYTIHQSHLEQKPKNRKYPPPVLGLLATLAFLSCLSTQLVKNKRKSNFTDEQTKAMNSYSGFRIISNVKNRRLNRRYSGLLSWDDFKRCSAISKKYQCSKPK